MLRDLGLSTLLIQGLFLACFAASSVLNNEIDDKTVLSVAAKPVARSVFLSGKLFGVFGAIATAHYLAGLVLYMVIRHGVLQAAYEKSDLTVIFLGLIPLASMLILGVLNYLFDWRYLPTVVTLFLITGSISTLVLLAIDRDWKIRPTKSFRLSIRFHRRSATRLFAASSSSAQTPGRPISPATKASSFARFGKAR